MYRLLSRTVLPCLCLLMMSCQTYSPVLTASEDLSPFTTDGCSMSADGTHEKPQAFLECCIQHDLAYWQGGTVEQKDVADQELKSCITQNSNEDIGNLYWQGVRLGGGPQFKTPFRWGYGWRLHRNYQALTPSELSEVKLKTEAIDWPKIYSDFGISK